MNDLIKRTIKECMIIYAVSAVTVILAGVVFSGSNEANMKGWVETYFSIVVLSNLAIFMLDKEIPLRHKWYGTVITSCIVTGLLYLWTEYGPRYLVLYGLIFTYPFILIVSKLLYKQFTKITYSSREQMSQ